VGSGSRRSSPALSPLHSGTWIRSSHTPAGTAGKARYQVFAGVDKDTPANELDQDIFSLTDNLTLALGNHTLTFGTHNELFRMRNLYLTNYYGNYEYSTLEDFLAIGTPNEVAPKSYG